MKKYLATAQGGRKRIFIGLLSISCLVACMFLMIFLIIPWLFPVHWLAALSIAVGTCGIVLLAWMCLTLVFHIYTGRSLPFISGIRHICIRILLPLMEVVGKLGGIDKNLVRRSFVKVNNEFVLAHARPMRAEKLLLLLPHCIQASQCRNRVGPDLSHCHKCGGCQIGEIRELAARHGFHAAMATGGTIARRLVAEIKPRGIIAIACERDLTSGIQDSYPIPVFGVLNQRPFGPCKDTVAPMEALKPALAFFLGKEKLE